eukprot:TRINITY_DN15176_c0_g1_i1.p1 TRINITY_DN15176_c0_g1~~TRINITY_DN15176_c0_g1_i1.p1  ORF type:complete len:675 (+),score=160.47 TRINITY_DN15176_c0_g1_i1:43-2025(+)
MEQHDGNGNAGGSGDSSVAFDASNPLVSLSANFSHPMQTVRLKALYDLGFFLRKADNNSSIISPEILLGFVLSLCNSTDAPEKRQSGFLAAKLLFQVSREDNTKNVWPLSQEFFDFVLDRALFVLVDDDDPRVRIAAGQCLAELLLCANNPRMKFDFIVAHLVPFVERSIGAYVASSSGDSVHSDEHKEVPTSRRRARSPSPVPRATMFEGAGKLETALVCLDKIILAGGESIWSRTVALIGLAAKCLEHGNRFVREACIKLQGSFIEVAAIEELKRNSIFLCESLFRGLSDNWSQVRFVASVATRTLLRKLCPSNNSDSNNLQPELDILVPAMCFNRYYLAEGVRNYSLETWKMVFQQSGKDQVLRRISAVVDFYNSELLSDNHTVRISACHCISELGNKLALPPLQPHVDELINTLLLIVHDSHWNVRCAAVTAIGDLLAKFPLDAEKSKFVQSVLFQSLKDKASVVREDAATALVSLTSNCDKLDLGMLFEYVDSSLPEGMKSVTSNCEHNEDEPESGCSHRHRHSNVVESWEVSEGSVFLLRELAPISPSEVAQRLSQLQNLVAHSAFEELKISIWNSLPRMCKAIGARVFKNYLSDFVDPLFKHLNRDEESPNLSHSAKSCILELSSLVGRSVFKARIESPDYVDDYLKLCSSSS